MRPSFAGIVCAAAISALAGTLYAQNSPPESPPAAAPPAFPTPGKAPTPESPQNTTNASAQAEAEYRAALAKCDARPQSERSACTNDAEEHFYGALSGNNPGLQGNPGSNTGATDTGK
jgi:hypothetical protein